jgi:peptidoglycan/xylan/chitin deacetylase (PgdA/CDA1 family)
LGYRPVDAQGVLSNQRRTYHVTFDDAFRNVAHVLPTLERLGAQVTVFVCTSFAENGAPFWVNELRDRMPESHEELATMSWQMLQDLAERGVEIGSHTVSHPHLPQLSDRELGEELRMSRERIEDELGRPCRFVAYPYGDHDGRTRASVRAAGYEAAFALRADRGTLDPAALPRVDIYRGDGAMRYGLKTSVLGAPAAALLAHRRGGPSAGFGTG